MIVPQPVKGTPMGGNTWYYQIEVMCPRCGMRHQLNAHMNQAEATVSYDIQGPNITFHLNGDNNWRVSSQTHYCTQNYTISDHVHPEYSHPMPVDRSQDILNLLGRVLDCVTNMCAHTEHRRQEDDNLRAKISLLHDQLSYAQADLETAKARIRELEGVHEQQLFGDPVAPDRSDL